MTKSETSVIKNIIALHKWSALLLQLPFGTTVWEFPSMSAVSSFRAVAYRNNLDPQRKATYALRTTTKDCVLEVTISKEGRP